MFDPHRFYTPAEVRTLSHAPRELVYAALDRGELRAIRRGRRWLVPGSAVLDWLSEQARRAEASP